MHTIMVVHEDTEEDPFLSDNMNDYEMEQPQRRTSSSFKWKFHYIHLNHDQVRVLFLSLTLFFIIGGYWLLRSLKDAVLSSLVGLEYQPLAKVYSLVVVLTVIFIYNALVDLVPRHYLFYILGSIYSIIFSLIACGLADPHYGLESSLPTGPHRWLGWISYFAIESYGSVSVSLFWSFVNSVYSFDGAKRSYGYIIAGAQVFCLCFLKCKK